MRSHEIESSSHTVTPGPVASNVLLLSSSKLTISLKVYYSFSLLGLDGLGRGVIVVLVLEGLLLGSFISKNLLCVMYVVCSECPFY